MNYLSIDTEYSSFFSPDRKKSGELLQIAIVPVINGIKQEPFNEYMRPLTKVWNINAEKVHKISRGQAYRAQHPKEAAAKLSVFLSKYDTMFTAIGHNPKGDKSYIERFIRDYGVINEWHRKVKNKWKCTKEIASSRKSLIPVKNYKLETLCKYFRIKINAHDALSDADVTASLYDIMNSMVAANDGHMSNVMELSEVDKIKKYMDIKYVMMNGDGCVFLTEYATSNREALRVILQEIWNTYGEA